MASNETVTEAICDLKTLGLDLRLRSYLKPEEIHNLSYMINSNSDEIFTAHKREIAAKDAEIAELRELLLELSDAANTAFDDIAKCGSIIADGDVRDAAYRTHLMERIAKYRNALKGENNEGK